MINISKRQLTRSQISLLTKGPKFCPTKNGNFLQIKSDTSDFTRKLKLMEIFHEYTYEENSIVKEKSNFVPVSKDKHLNEIVSKIEHTDPPRTKCKDNIKTSERNALNELTSYNDIVIKKADKGNTLVIMDAEFYRDKLVLHDHLLQPTYRKVKESEAKVTGKLKKLLKEHKDCLTTKEIKYINDFEWGHSNLYVLPKIHKNKTIIEKVNETDNVYLHMNTPSDLKARPIISGRNSQTSRLSELLEKILTPLVPNLKSFVKDDYDMLRKLPRTLEPNFELYSFDVVSLYTNISHELGIEALSYWYDKLRHLIPRRITKEFLLKACSFVLKNNFFQFDAEFWHQLIGTAMGTKFAPPYACLTMGYLEETKLYPKLPLLYTPSVCRMIIEMFLRYIDDCFTPWPRDLDINTFKDTLNQLHPDIQFTMEKCISYTEDGKTYQRINFLDIMIILCDDGKIITDIYYKDTNTHDYLNYESAHPTHTKNNIPYTLAKKIHVFCTDPKTESKRMSDLREYLINSSYDTKIIDRGFKNALLQGPANKPTNNVTMVSTYVQNYDIKHITKEAQKLFDECNNPRIRKIFGDTKITLATKQPPNLVRQLTSASFVSEGNNEQRNGLFKCRRTNCEMCQMFVQEGASFETSNGTVWNVQGHVTCKSRNVLYFLKCLACNGATTYTGKTKTQFNIRVNNHRKDCRSGETSDTFDLHVHECIKTNNFKNEPFFQVFAFLTVKEESMLLTYETYLHKRGFDTMNV